MRHEGCVWARSSTVLVIAVSAAWSVACGPASGSATAAAAVEARLSQATACGPAVLSRGQVIRVEPVGAAKDTANLQCAFDLAAASPGSTVQLARGTFVSDALFVHGLVGEVRGEGEEETVVTNVPVVHVNPAWWTSGAPPAKDNVYPFLWTFTDGRFSMRHLKFRIQGAAPTSGWRVPGVDATISSLAGVLVVAGQDPHAAFSDVVFEGEGNPLDPIYGYNLYNGVYFEPLPFGAPPVTGRFSVDACGFKSMASWAPIANVADAMVHVVNNDVEDVFFALDIFSVARSNVLYGGNRVQGAVIAWVGEGGPLDASLVILAANRFQAQQGLLIDGTFSGGTRCVIAGNWIDPPTAGITLGPETTHCLVASNHGATVVDQGTGNHVAGH